MTRRKIPQEVEVDSFCMTPMIDIVFQIIIFFMVALDLSRQQVETVTLPKASEAEEITESQPNTVIINLLADGTTKINGDTFYLPKWGDQNGKLETFLHKQTLLERTRHGYPIRIRADRSTPFEHIQKVLMMATYYGGPTEVEFSAMLEGETK